MSNVFFSNMYTLKDKERQDSEFAAAYGIKQTIMSLNYYFNKFNPDSLVIAFDSYNWRKDYTKDDICVSKRPYKNRPPKDPDMMARFREFCEILKTNTSIICLQRDGLEADDLIAGFVQKYSNDECVILSKDKDFKQLLSLDNVSIYNTNKKEFITIDEPVDYMMFKMFVRGDSGDNISSAYPNVRETKIKKAFEDKFEYVNFMNQTWSKKSEDENEITYRVGDLFEENKLLIDLFNQPECVRRRIFETIDEAMSNKNKYSHFKFTRFLMKYNMKREVNNISNYTNWLAS